MSDTEKTMSSNAMIDAKYLETENCKMCTLTVSIFMPCCL